MIYKNIDGCYFNIINENKILKLESNSIFIFIDYDENNQYLTDEFLFYFNVNHYTKSNIEYSIHHKFGYCFNKETYKIDVLDNRNKNIMFKETLNENNKQLLYQSLENNLRYIKDDKVKDKYKDKKYKPKITIIIPTYNTNTSQIKRGAEYCGNFFMNAVKSILNQTFIDYELLIINDGITDDTIYLLNDFENLNIPNIKIISFKDKEGNIINKGLNYWRSESIKMASCEFVRFLDSDDMLYSDCLEKCWNTKNKYNVDCVFHVYESLVDKKPIPDVNYNTIFNSHELISRSTWLSTLFKKSIYLKLKEEREILNNLKWLMEDEIALFFYLCIDQKCTFIPEKLYFYRNENRYINNNDMFENFYNTMRFLLKNKEYYKFQKFLIVFRDAFTPLIDLRNKNYDNLTIKKLKEQTKDKKKAENIYINIEAGLKYRRIYKNLFKMNKEVIKIIKNISNHNLSTNYIKPDILIPLKNEIMKYQNQLINFINE